MHTSGDCLAQLAQHRFERCNIAFTPLSAKNAKVRINNVVYTAKRWVVTPVADEIDTSNFEGAGFTDRIAGLSDCEFTVDADWDSAGNNFANPPNIVIGQTLSTVKLFLNDTSSVFWLFPSALITTTPTTAEVRGAIIVSFTAKNKGTFTYPV
jgi:hypothetical protein